MNGHSGVLSCFCGALPTAVPCTRLHAKQLLWEWGITELSESVELVVSELTTNAIAASRSLDWICPVRLWLLSDTRQVLILVWDAHPDPPVRIDPERDAERGRGLMLNLVDAISRSWDWYTVPDTTQGKVVWALCES